MTPEKEAHNGTKEESPDQVIRLLKQVDVLTAQGQSIEKSRRELGVSDALYYKWRKEYGGMQVESWGHRAAMKVSSSECCGDATCPSPLLTKEGDPRPISYMFYQC